MADEILRSRHAFGTSAGISAALSENKIDEFDILFLTDPDGNRLAWIDKNGNVQKLDVGMSETDVTTKIDAAVVESKSYADKKIDEKVTEAIDFVVAEVKNTVSTIEYEISHKPEGTLVDVRDKEIRILCPNGTVFEKQNSGSGADVNCYYIGFRAYAPSNDVVSFKEDLAETISDNSMYYFENNEFAGIDTNGRKYSIVWLPVAKYDSSTATWTYYGADSSEKKYIGWYYSVEWFNAKGKVVASDCIRINLSNESCHSSIAPFYVTAATVDEKIEEQIDTKVEEKVEEKVEVAVVEANNYTDEKIAEVANAYKIVEF